MSVALQELKAIPLFSELGEAELSTLAAAKVRRKYPRNATVLNDGDTTKDIYIVNRGKVKVCKNSADGKEVVIAMLSAGDHFGEISLIDEEPRSSSVVTHEACELTIIRKSDFDRVLLNNPRLAVSMMKGLCKRLRAADRSIESLALMDVYGRVTRLLGDLAKPVDGKLQIKDPMTQNDIAQRVGSSREMVSRILKDLITGGYISVDSRRITIHSKLPTAW